MSLPKKIWEKFLLEFQVCLYILYIFTSPSAENKEMFVHLGRHSLPSCPVGYSLGYLKAQHVFIYSIAKLLYVVVYIESSGGYTEQFPNEPRREKTGLRGFRPGPTQTGLYKLRKELEA